MSTVGPTDHAARDQSALRSFAAGHELAPQLSARRVERMVEVAWSRLASVTVVLENLWDSHNASAVVRSAEALGLHQVQVVEQPNRYRRHAAILRGADRWLQVRKHREVSTCLADLRTAGYLLCAADLGPQCTPLSELPVDRSLALIFGSEHNGLSSTAREETDLRFTVPMRGMTESFNVSVSAAISLFDVTRRRRARLALDGDLDQRSLETLVAFWIRRSRRQPRATTSAPSAQERASAPRDAMAQRKR